MFDILRRFSPSVEEYSIDEAFIDLTGLRRIYRGSYESIAKIGSQHKKSSGLTTIRGRDIHLFLGNMPIEKVWGTGPNTSAYLKNSASSRRSIMRGRMRHLSKISLEAVSGNLA